MNSIITEMKSQGLGYRLTRWAGLGLISLFARMVEWTEGRKPVLDPAILPPWANALRHDWPTIREEAMQVLSTGADKSVRDFFREQGTMMEGTNWRTYAFLLYGVEFTQHLGTCPVTASHIRKARDISSAHFSILPPGSRLTPHYGPYKGVLRYHLGLIVPKDEEKCGLVVDGIRLMWKEGEVLLFDDTYLHEAWNLSDETRIVLFLDVIRPLPFPLNVMNRVLFGMIARSPYIRDALHGAEQLEELHYVDKPLDFG